MNTNTVARPAESPSSALAGLVDDLAARAQAGERIDLEAVLRRHPEHADELRRLWPALGAMHDLSRSRDADRAGAVPPRVARACRNSANWATSGCCGRSAAAAWASFTRPSSKR